ncbi:MAG: MFS transporter [Bacteroidales bacterium]|nr:MFS transporter [Bacteroidales bacterium]
MRIGNTIIQVSANPLIIDVVPSNRRSSFLSFSQFIKSIGSMIAPFVASYFALRFGNWKLVFLVFGVFSILTVIWLHFTPVTEILSSEKKATFSSAFRLLGIPFILLMVLGIFFVVGIDVGINATSGQFLMDKMGMAASNIFPLIFSITVGNYPTRTNEISGLMIMAISGGAFIPLLVGTITDAFTIHAGMYVFAACAIYLIFIAIIGLSAGKPASGH